jgi:hypothetical protein
MCRATTDRKIGSVDGIVSPATVVMPSVTHALQESDPVTLQTPVVVREAAYCGA